jgi:hypothetical protein
MAILSGDDVGCSLFPDNVAQHITQKVLFTSI